MFSSVEAAWLVYQCHDATMTERLSAWKDIVATMPDHPVENSFHFGPYESLHQVLNRYISVIESTICQMAVGAPDIIYQYSVVYNDGYNGNSNDSKPYSTFRSCLENMNKDLSEADDSVLYGRIMRIHVDSGRRIHANYNLNGELIYISFPPDYNEEDDIVQHTIILSHPLMIR